MTQLEALQKHLAAYDANKDLFVFIEAVKNDKEAQHAEFGEPLMAGQDVINNKIEFVLDVVENEDNVLRRIIITEEQLDICYSRFNLTPF